MTGKSPHARKAQKLELCFKCYAVPKIRRDRAEEIGEPLRAAPGTPRKPKRATKKALTVKRRTPRQRRAPTASPSPATPPAPTAAPVDDAGVDLSCLTERELAEGASVALRMKREILSGTYAEAAHQLTAIDEKLRRLGVTATRALPGLNVTSEARLLPAPE